MTREEAEIYAKTMTYEDALYNLSQARATPYRKATFIKVNELIKALSQEPTDRIEYGTDGNAYKLWISNGKEFEQEPCDDAISREMALKECHDIVIDGERYRVIQEETLLGLPPVKPKADCENCSKCEDAFMRGHDVGLENGYKQGERDARYESATQKPKTGHWIAHSDGGIWIKYYECSECRKAHDTRSDYCPNCGAKMESENI